MTARSRIRRGEVSLLWVALLCLPLAVAAQTSLPNDPYLQGSGSWGQAYADQWSLRLLEAYPVAATASMRPVIAIIDTGLDFEHPDLAANQLWRNAQETPNGRDDDGNGYVDDLIGWNFADGNGWPADESGHGTHVSGLVAACTDNALGIAGLAPQAVLMPLKVASYRGQARAAAVAQAIGYAVQQGAHIINLSLGGSVASPMERDAVAAAVAAGTLVVVSAGNDGAPADGYGYAAIEQALVVGASAPADLRAGFSNFGARVDLLSPGVDLLSLRAAGTDFIALSRAGERPAGTAVVGDDAEYYRASGTSFAAAIVTGVAARVLSARPGLDGPALKRLLVQSAQDLHAPGVDALSGYGRIDLVAALAAPADRELRARIEALRLAYDDERLWLVVHGEASADALAERVLSLRLLPAEGSEEAGADEAAAPWQRVTLESGPEGDAQERTLGRLDLTPWLADGLVRAELRLLVRHADGSERLAHHAFALPEAG